MAAIPLDELVKGYFHSRREFVPDLPRYADLRTGKLLYTYSDLCRWPEPRIPRANPFLAPEPEVLDAAAAAVGHLYNARPADIKVMEMAEMLNGKTCPIRIVADVNGVEKTCYAKLPDASRFLLLELFNIVSGRKPMDFVFNQEVSVDEHVPGTLHNDLEFPELVADPRYVEQRVRLDAHCQLLGINDLVANGENLSVDAAGNIYVLDFDEGLKFRKESLLSGLPMDLDHMCAVLADEKRLILRRVAKEQSRMSALVHMMQAHAYNAEEAAKYQVPGVQNMGDYVSEVLNEWTEELRWRGLRS